MIEKGPGKVTNGQTVVTKGAGRERFLHRDDIGVLEL
jgi:hypothetical protein